jgi:hypothetical protein
VNTFGQAGRQITGLQQVGWQEGAQPQLFSAPQQLWLTWTTPAFAVAVIPIAAKTALHSFNSFMT